MELDITIPEEARQRYLERRKTDLSTLQNALRDRSYEEFKRIGHQLKGNAASFGYPDLEKIAIRLELAGLQEDTAEAALLVSQFENWLSQTLNA